MATSSDLPVVNIDLKLPTGWEVLTDKQLRYLFGLLSLNFPSQQVKTYCLINAAITSLDWIDTLPTMPVRIARIGWHRAVPADFEGVPFETFIVCDNLYQGYLSTRQEDLLDELAAHLYDTKRIKLTAAERVSVFYWFASLKAFLAKVFKHFFQPAGNASGADGNMIEHGGSQ